MLTPAPSAWRNPMFPEEGERYSCPSSGSSRRAPDSGLTLEATRGRPRCHRQSLRRHPGRSRPSAARRAPAATARRDGAIQRRAAAHPVLSATRRDLQVTASPEGATDRGANGALRAQCERALASCHRQSRGRHHRRPTTEGATDVKVARPSALPRERALGSRCIVKKVQELKKKRGTRCTLHCCLLLLSIFLNICYCCCGSRAINVSHDLPHGEILKG